jgi:peptidoglycan/xylan/chitin deacetylase (PgdA/CDA1 family)
MKRKISKKTFFMLIFAAICLVGVFFSIFFDQAIIVRRGTVYQGIASGKVVALTFDDGPSPIWTPKILDELKKENVKATFFMLGKHVEKYPSIAKRVAEEGHEIGNHSYSHHIIISEKLDNLIKEIKNTERIIRNVTGRTTIYFRPPKAWINGKERAKIESLGYKAVLWTLNSKDWVTFDDKYMVNYLIKNMQAGDIILFHDSGGAFSIEGGDRHETVKTIPLLIDKLRGEGYRFVTISELLNSEK